MGKKRTIRAKDIMTDLRANMTDSEIMSKYSLSAKGLESIFDKLIEARVLTDKELRGRVPIFQDTVNLDNARCLPRSYLAFSLPIYDTDDLQVEGTVRDLSERGLQVAGIEARVNESKEFLVRADELQDIYPFVFTAECRWVTQSCETNEAIAGFEITEISKGSQEQVREILRALTLSGNDEATERTSDGVSAPGNTRAEDGSRLQVSGMM